MARIGRKLAELRMGRSWTQADVAQKIGVSQSLVSQVERGGTVNWSATFDYAALFEIPREKALAMMDDNLDEVEEAIDGATSLRPDDRDLLAGIYSLMKKRGAPRS